MAYSYFDYEGTDTTIQTDILCVSTEHMYAFKVFSEEKSNVTLSDVALPATFTKNNAGVLCELKTAPSTKIRVIRSTPYDVLMHDFSNGAQFNAHSVDEVYEQLLYLFQELVEGKLVIDKSGNFGDASAGGRSQNELQAELAAKYSLGYSEGTAAGTAAGDAAGYSRGYSRGYSSGYSSGYSEGDAAGYTRGYSDGDAAGYTRGEAAGKAAGDAAGYTRGEAAGKAAGYSEGKAAGYSEGEAAGKAAGYASGYSEGEAAGKAAGGGSGSGSGGGSELPEFIYKQTVYSDVRYGLTPEEACSGVMSSYNLTMRFENGTCNAYRPSDGKYSSNHGVPEKIRTRK